MSGIARHGYARDGRVTPVYRTWCNMKNRCMCPANPKYHDYGGRGIAVCERWLKFENFLADMGDRPEGKTLDRIDVNGHYEPGNCRWATHKEQQNNMRSNVTATLWGRTQTLSQWAEELGIKKNTLVCRVRRGWTPERAVAEVIGPSRFAK